MPSASSMLSSATSAEPPFTHSPHQNISLPNIAAFNVALSACADTRDCLCFRHLCDQMPNWNAPPVVLTYNVLIKIGARRLQGPHRTRPQPDPLLQFHPLCHHALLLHRCRMRWIAVPGYTPLDLKDVTWNMAKMRVTSVAGTSIHRRSSDGTRWPMPSMVVSLRTVTKSTAGFNGGSRFWR
uniref:Uncharacterized protein n=2 Tax=Oryza sativa subsp. japonica TaxID=39947 RepID=Q7G4N0_ORYSJ|nr:hypothetical protein [Oryza sativa Japonica Group]AAP52550.1 expressed protein [Oryza sativa Japonica Group]